MLHHTTAIDQQTATYPFDIYRPDPIARLGELPPRWRRALTELLGAFDYAQSGDVDVWQFAVEIAELRAAGLNNSDCRWLVCASYVQHALEDTGIEDKSRRFRPVHNLAFSGRSCVVLTGAGVSLARALLLGLEPPLVDRRMACDADELSERSVVLVPNWDAERHELRLGGYLVKRFRLSAGNQERILAAFEEEGWPARIDDPLPPKLEHDPKRRLHDTIKCLNRNQKHRLLRFGGDGTGEGAIWGRVCRINAQSR